jgi:hypothetical protein
MESGMAQAAGMRKPDWLGVFYFGFFALLCLYDLFSGAKAVSAFAASPLIFTLLVSAIFIILLYFARLLSALGKSVGSRISPNESEKVGNTMLMGGMLLALAYGVFSQLDNAGKAEIFSLSSLVFVAVSVFQVVVSTYPQRMDGRLDEKLHAWSKSAVSFGATPGIAAFAGVVIIILLAGLLTSNDIRMAMLRGTVFFALFLFTLSKSQGIMPRTGPQASWAKKAGVLMLSFALAVAFTIALPWLLEGLVAASEHFLALFVAYAVLAAKEYEGKPDKPLEI